MSEQTRQITGKETKTWLLAANYWEVVFFLAYGAILCYQTIPGLKWDFDGHDSTLLMSSYRIWSGQVPFREFYPWYGPLYHYFLAFFTGLMGNDLYALKFYIDIISPLLSMLILVLALRNFGLTALSRLFVLTGAAALGLERIYYCGSLRSILPVFLASWLFRIFRGRKKAPYLFIVPAGVVLFLFSPESGVYSVVSSLVFMAAAMLLIDGHKQRVQTLGYYLAGVLISLTAIIILFFSAGWFRNYLEYISIISNNFYWSHGSSPLNMRDYPVFLQFLSLPLIYSAAGLGVLIHWRRAKKLPEQFLLVATLTTLGVLLAYKFLLEFHPTRFQFSFLPALVLAGLAWAPPYRPVKAWKITAQAVLIVFLVTGGKAAIPVISPAPYHGKDYQTLMGVRVSPQTAADYAKIKSFCADHQNDRIAFPLKTIYYLYLNAVPDLPFDDLHYAFHPKFRELTLDALRQGRYKYLVINQDDIFWDYPGESVDPLFDYIDENYSSVNISIPVWVYALNQNPGAFTEVLAEDRQAILLDKNNKYSFNLNVPAVFDPDYLEFEAEFDYQPEVLSGFSMPVVQCRFDNQKWDYGRPEAGRQRINPQKGRHHFRLYLWYVNSKLNFQVTFPGPLNFAPDKIRITRINWRRFDHKKHVPRAMIYGLEK